MQAKKRYSLLVIAGVLFILACYFFSIKSLHKKDGEFPLSFSKRGDLRPYADADDYESISDMHLSPKQRRESAPEFKKQRCRMETCFNYTKCEKDFKVYVYPVQERVSESYSKILISIQDSKYYTSNPEEACIFILSIDTLDRDVLSQNYAKDIQSKIDRLPLWNNGRNHILFNLYSGTWPDYSPNLDFDIGEAMLAKSSISVHKFRPGFDISFPLVGKDHPHKGGERGHVYISMNNIPPLRYYLLAFKGKRYLTGIGSETRNSLYHVHNGEEIVLLTTCRHGKSWQKKARELNDTRCEVDNKEYDR